MLRVRFKPRRSHFKSPPAVFSCHQIGVFQSEAVSARTSIPSRVHAVELAVTPPARGAVIRQTSARSRSSAPLLTVAGAEDQWLQITNWRKTLWQQQFGLTLMICCPLYFVQISGGQCFRASLGTFICQLSSSNRTERRRIPDSWMCLVNETLWWIKMNKSQPCNFGRETCFLFNSTINECIQFLIRHGHVRMTTTIIWRGFYVE